MNVDKLKDRLHILEGELENIRETARQVSNDTDDVVSDLEGIREGLDLLCAPNLVDIDIEVLSLENEKLKAELDAVRLVLKSFNDLLMKPCE